MPYKLRKAPKRDLYWVVGPDGKHHSKEPLPKARAEAQRKALYAAERREDEARIPTAREEKAIDRKTEGGGVLKGGATHKDRFERVVSLLMDWVGVEEIDPFILFDVYNMVPRDDNDELEDVNQQHLDAVRAYLQPELDDNKMSDITDILDDDGVVAVAGGGNHHALHGAGPLPELTILQQIAKAAYSTSPPRDIGPFKLRSATPTLKFYVLTEPSDQRHIDTVVVGIRGTNTSDKQDLYADAKLALGQLGDTPRWKKDLDDFNAFMSRLSDPKSIDVYGVGHSLGGAVLDMFLKAGLIKQGVSYNPAISMGDAQKDIPNRRIYQDGDPLLAIMGRSAKNVEIRPKKQKKESFFGKVANAASYFIPYVGLVKKGMDTLDAHALDNFTGGYTSKVQDKPDVIDRLEDIAVVKRSKGYYVYAIDGETQATKRWGPFTKKVAEFEKKLLHQRQRHHLQPIAEEGEEGGMRGGAGTVGMAQAFMTIIGDEVARLPPRARQAIQFLAQGIEVKLKSQRRKGRQREKMRDLLDFIKQVVSVIFNEQEKIVDDRRPEVIDEYNQRILRDEINPLLASIDPNLNMRFRRDDSRSYRIVVEYYDGDTPIPYEAVEARAAEESDEEEGVGAPAPELAPPAPAPERAAFPPTQPRGRGKKVCMPKKEYLAEHKQLTDVLARPTPAKLRKELAKQTAEVKSRGSGKDDFDFPVVRKGDKKVELSGPRTAAMMNQKRREKAEAERRIRERAEREEAERIARQRQIDASDEERERERRRAESRRKVTSGFGHSDYLRKARANAKAYGLDPKKLTMGDGKHKFSYDGIGFGLKSYNDFLLLSAEEKAGRVPKGTAEKKRKAYRARAEKIKGNWKDNKISPNNLAIHILWA